MLGSGHGQNLYPAILGGITMSQLSRSIAGAVIQDQQPPVAECLPDNAFDGLTQKLDAVTHRHQHIYRGHGLLLEFSRASVMRACHNPWAGIAAGPRESLSAERRGACHRKEPDRDRSARSMCNQAG